MLNVEQRLKAILEGVGSDEITFPQRDPEDFGGLDDQMVVLESDLELLEEALFEAISESISNASIYEADAKDSKYVNIIFKRIRDNLRSLVPSKVIKDLKVVREYVINTWLERLSNISYVVPPLGLIFGIIYLTRRLLKMKNMTAQEAKESIQEAEKLKSDLEKVASKLYKEGNKTQGDKIKAQIREIDNAVGVFRQKYSIVLGKKG